MSADITAAAQPDLTWDEAMGLASASRDQLNARLRAEAKRPRHEMRERETDGLRPDRRWAWQVVNLTDGAVCAEGWAWTKRQMYRRRYQAYLRVLPRRADRRAES